MNKTSTTERGAISELIFRVEARKRGYHSLKFEEGAPIDVVIYNTVTGRFFKVQVKSCEKREERGTFRFHTETGRGLNRARYSVKDVDVFACYVFETEEWFLIPSVEAVKQSMIRLHEQHELYKHKNDWSIFDAAN